MATTINDILQEIRLKSMTEREKGTDFERLMKLWFLTDPRYADLEKVWLWEEFPARKDFGGKDLGIDLVAETLVNRAEEGGSRRGHGIAAPPRALFSIHSDPSRHT